MDSSFPPVSFRDLTETRLRAALDLERAGELIGSNKALCSKVQYIKTGPILWLLVLIWPFGLLKPASSVLAQKDPKPAAETAPAGTIIPFQLKDTINSRTAFDGQDVCCETIFPVALNNHILIPAHSYMRGHATEVDRPGHIMGKAQLGIRMDSLILPDGKTWPIRSAVYSLAGARLSPDEAKKRKW